MELSFSQETVHKLLKASDKPLKAYNILFETQKLGIKSPTQVYRALDKLIELGKVHKIESKYAFVACSKINCSNQNSTFFLICDNNRNIIDLEDQKITDQLNKTYEQYEANIKITL